MSKTTALTNREVALRIDRSDALISMMRLGKRLPGMSTMLAIEESFGWTMQEQARAAQRGTFAKELNEHLHES